MKEIVRDLGNLSIYLILDKGEGTNSDTHLQYAKDSKIVYGSLSPQLDSCILDLMDGKDECLGNSTLDIRPGIVVKSCPYSDVELDNLGSVEPKEIISRIPELLAKASEKFCPNECSLIYGKEIAIAKKTSQRGCEKESSQKRIHARRNEIAIHDRWDHDGV
jgi:hypothetical protein